MINLNIEKVIAGIEEILLSILKSLEVVSNFCSFSNCLGFMRSFTHYNFTTETAFKPKSSFLAMPKCKQKKNCLSRVFRTKNEDLFFSISAMVGLSVPFKETQQ